MSFYDDASLVFLAGGAAGKDGKAYNLKPVEELSSTEVVINGDFSIDGPGTDGELGTAYGDYGWNTVSSSAGTQEGTTTISNGVLKLTNASGETDSRAYATDGVSSRNVITTNAYYKLVYTIVENNGCTSFKIYNAGGVQEDAPSSVGTHTVTLRNTSNQLFLFFNKTESSSISIDNVSIREITNQLADFTFARGTNLTATRVGKDGYIEKGRENVLLNSDDFSIAGASGGWIKNNATVTSGYAGYDGTTNAWKLESTILTSNNNVNQKATNNAAITPLGSKVATFSVYLKAGTTNWARLNLNGTGNVYFDLENGQVGTVSSVWVSGQIESAGNGWWRCSITRLTGNAFDACFIYLAESDGSILPLSHSTSEHIFVQHPQLEYGLVATDYIETGASTAKAGLLEDEPRFDYTGGGCPALLMEVGAINLVNQSEYFGDYLTASATVTQNALVSPEGLQNASTVNVTSNAGSMYTESGNGVESVTASTVYTFSFYVKQGTNTENYLAVRDNTGGVFIDTDVAYTASSSEWTRVEHTFTTPAGCVSVRLYPQRYSSGGQGTTHIWGMQLEEGDFATSYIPTYGAAATRTQDQPEELEHGITMGTSCSVFFEGKHVAPDAGQISMLRLRIGTDANNRLLIYGTAAGATTFPLVVQHKVSGGLSVNTTSKTLNINESFKVLARMNGTTMDVFINGAIHDTETITATDIYDKVSLYRTPSTDQSGHAVKQVILFDSALSNEECEDLTEL